MASPLLVLEGTWEEVVAHASELAGRRVRLTVIPGLIDVAPAAIAQTLVRDPDRVARVRSVRGRFARTGGVLASEASHQERQADKKREEDAIQGTPA
jgi:hypothetical protein